MKKILLLILWGVGCLLMMSCNNDKHVIIKSAYGYLDAMGNYKIEDAFPYATEETKKLTLEYLINVIMPISDTNYIQSNTPANIEIVKVNFINDSVASVDYTKHTPIKEQKGALEMHKCGEKWLAHVVINNRMLRPISSRKEMDSVGSTMQRSVENGELKAVSVEELAKQNQSK